MTKKEFMKMPFVYFSYENTDSGCTTTYRAKHPELNLLLCIHTPYQDGAPSGKPKSYYIYNNLVFTSIDELIAQINRTSPMSRKERDSLSGWCIRQAEHTAFLTTQDEKERYASALYLAALWGRQTF